MKAICVLILYHFFPLFCWFFVFRFSLFTYFYSIFFSTKKNNELSIQWRVCLRAFICFNEFHSTYSCVCFGVPVHFRSVGLSLSSPYVMPCTIELENNKTEKKNCNLLQCFEAYLLYLRLFICSFSSILYRIFRSVPLFVLFECIFFIFQFHLTHCCFIKFLIRTNNNKKVKYFIVWRHNFIVVVYHSYSR